MTDLDVALTRLYLPLLCNPQIEVRQQAYAILLGTYGARGVSALRDLLADADAQTRLQVSQSLRSIGSAGAAPAERRMSVQCLGGLRVSLGGRAVQPRDWMQRAGGRAGWRKVQGVFAYLVYRERRGASRQELAEAVWAGGASATSLSRTLTALRQMLLDLTDPSFVEQALVITRDHVTLAPEVYTSDVQAFESAFQLACCTESERDLDHAAPLYAQVIQRYAGPYLDDVPCDGEWLQRRRDYLAGSAVIAAERLAEHAYGQRRYQQCAAICRRAIEVDESAEEVTVWLLRAYARLNQYSDLAQAFRDYLRAAAIDPGAREAEHDQVVRAYHELVASR